MKNPLAFMFADPSSHGSGPHKMGKPHKSAADADRAGWEKTDETGGFYYPAPRRGILRGRRRT